MHNKCMGWYRNLGRIVFCALFVSIMVKRKSLLKVSPLYDSWSLYQGTYPSPQYNPPIRLKTISLQQTNFIGASLCCYYGVPLRNAVNTAFFLKVFFLSVFFFNYNFSLQFCSFSTPFPCFLQLPPMSLNSWST